MLEKLKHFIGEWWRLKTPLFIIVVYLGSHYAGFAFSSSSIQLVFFKLYLASVAVVFGHIVWSEMFYYIGFGDLMSREDPKFGSIAIMRAIFQGALIIGFMLGI